MKTNVLKFTCFQNRDHMCFLIRSTWFGEIATAQRQHTWRFCTSTACGGVCTKLNFLQNALSPVDTNGGSKKLVEATTATRTLSV